MARAPKAPRQDPRSKTTDYSVQLNELSNTDPDRKYTLVDPNSRFYGQAYFESMGYRVELKTVDGVRFTRGGMRSENGSALMCMDLVLMSCPIEDAEERARYKQEQADIKDMSMTRGRGKIDRPGGAFSDLPVSPQDGVHAVNETEDARRPTRITM